MTAASAAVQCCIILLQLMQDDGQKFCGVQPVSNAAKMVEALDHCNFAAIVRFSFIIILSLCHIKFYRSYSCI